VNITSDKEVIRKTTADGRAYYIALSTDSLGKGVFETGETGMDIIREINFQRIRNAEKADSLRMINDNLTSDLFKCNEDKVLLKENNKDLKLGQKKQADVINEKDEALQEAGGEILNLEKKLKNQGTLWKTLTGVASGVGLAGIIYGALK